MTQIDPLLFQTLINPDLEGDEMDMERRSADRAAMATLLKEMNSKLTGLVTQLGELSAEVKVLSSGFPGGDPSAHRIYHEAVIRREQLRAAFWEKLVYELAKWGIIGVVAWLSLVAWRAFIKGPG